MFVLYASVLPPRVSASIESCTAMSGPNGVWVKLEENISKAAVIKEIISEMEAIRTIRQKTVSEMRVVLDRLIDLSRRVTEVGKQSGLQSPTVLHIVSSKLEQELYYEFERWMRHDHPAEELSVNRIVELLRTETEAREQIAPTKIIRPDAKWKPSVNHFIGVRSSRAGVHQRTSTNMIYSDPCTLGCGVHHKFIDCPVFQEQRPWQRRDTIKTAERCYSWFCRHKNTECTKPKQCSECGGCHHKMLNCLTSLSSANSPAQCASMYSPSTQRQLATSPMNPAGASFTSQPRTTSTTPNPTHGFLGHVLGQHDIRRFSPTTYVEIRDVNGVWHEIVAFFDSGSDTTLIKSSLAKRIGLVGTSELFRYGVAGGGSKLERSTRCMLQVRPMHAHKNHGYALEAMGIKQPAHGALPLVRLYSTTSRIFVQLGDVYRLPEQLLWSSTMHTSSSLYAPSPRDKL